MSFQARVVTVNVRSDANLVEGDVRRPLPTRDERHDGACDGEHSNQPNAGEVPAAATGGNEPNHHGHTEEQQQQDLRESPTRTMKRHERWCITPASIWSLLHARTDTMKTTSYTDVRVTSTRALW